ncbi:MAG TPA: hypothetical protein VIK01_15780 [Polyangiaceae bacterium]
MRTLDVLDEISGFGRSEGEPWAGRNLSQEDRQAAVMAMTTLFTEMKLGHLEAADFDRLFEVLGAVTAAIVAARKHTRGPLRVIPQGEPT